MKEVKESMVLKLIAYITIPITILFISIYTFSLIYSEEYSEDIKEEVTFFDTKMFAEEYRSFLLNAISLVSRENNLAIEQEGIQQEISEGTKMIYEISPYLMSRYEEYHILIIRNDGKAFTNLDNITSLEEMKETILQEDYVWKYENGEVKTNIKRLSLEKLASSKNFQKAKEQQYQIYMSVENPNGNAFEAQKFAFELAQKNYRNASGVIVVSGVLLVISFLYCVASIGHKKGIQGIYTNSLDKIPLEIVGCISIIVFALEGVLLAMFIELATFRFQIALPFILLMAILIYISLVILGVTGIRRIKAGVFWKNTICYRICHKVFSSTKNVVGEVTKDMNVTMKLGIFYVGFIVLSSVFFMINIRSGNVFFILSLLGIWYVGFLGLLKVVNMLKKIRKQIQQLYQGNMEEKLEESEFKGELQQVAKELNDISGGLSNAIEERLKSERLKTELITNVSHDIKTPLTSIINYVDLLKKEEIPNETVQEYLAILENKSQRLKKLTEDLIEASKASSGNIKLNLEKLKVKELMKQVSGEFEDRLNQRNLQIVETMPKEEVYIRADSKLMFRVLENMYTNISKYALENSRVYIDVETRGDKVDIILKNISKEKLNISVEELMQRFVRGDSARTTEGNGLGISIAKSLTELQKGQFNMYLDGDLFKVVIEFEKMTCPSTIEEKTE